MAGEADLLGAFEIDIDRAETGTSPLRSLKLLTVTTLFPNKVMPTHGIFVENRLRRVASLANIALRVVAPVPWFPSRAKMFGSYAEWASVPRAEMRHGIQVTPPRYPMIPKLGTALQPFLL